ncbi:MAG TPA: asparagine synthase (glutamine-hydrolyzing) [Nitrospiraceae bacterium]|nr:asparagine synthase (glutamine-hydrolyzing) [Nitrospiraceae bacterium]
MCGVVGALVFDGSTFRITEPYLARMRETMTHRGPDGAGLWIAPDGRVGLGHRRLSIIDLSEAAAQPMCNEDGSLWVSFNGEIYNHREIRQELEAYGEHHWKTDHSDTEVILHAFEQWGIECLHRFRGMFAIALWDAKIKELWLVRDRIGIKPLYYSFHHGRVTFASEIKALLQDPDQPKSLDEEAFYHYLSFLVAPAPQTLFAGIRKIPGGTCLRIRQDGTVSETRYWDVWDQVTSIAGLSDEEIAQCLLSELRTAVKLRKASDVPVGVFLSGGIDSSTNAALFSEGEPQPVNTFTIGYDGEYGTYANELAYARVMANRIGADHHERLLSIDDLIDFVPQMVRLQDEPIADPVCVPVYYVSQLARQNKVIVCQVGEGADELFWGYPGWKTALALQRLDNLPLPKIMKQAGLAGLRKMGKEDSRRYELLRRGSVGQPVFWGGAEAFTESKKRKLLSASLRAKFRGFTSWEALAPIRSRFEAKAWERTPLQWMTYLDLNMRLPELLLMRVDKMSMGVSVEGRVPFLDHKVVELAMSMPQAVKTRNGTLKYILKRAVRGVIPDQLIDRPKQGFGVPVYEWFFDRLGEYSKHHLDLFCKRTDYFDRCEVDRLIESKQGPEVWYLLNFALWWNEYID